jgi:peptidyl-dipeptidase A
MLRKLLLFSLLLPLLMSSACRQQNDNSDDGKNQTRPVTVSQVESFIIGAEQELDRIIQQNETVAWRHSTNITETSGKRAAVTMQQYLALRMRLALESISFADVPGLPGEVKRKLGILKQGITMPAPADVAFAAEQASISTRLRQVYQQGEYCHSDGDCLDLPQLGDIMAESRDPGRLLEVWEAWRDVSPPMKPLYARQLVLANQGATALGFSDLGDMWRSGYDMPAIEFSGATERLWAGVKPLYESLHCHVRARLSDFYGPAIVEQQQPIAAHLLGDMWAQNWRNIYSLVRPSGAEAGTDLSAALKARDFDAIAMVRTAESFFVSLGFETLPASFWQRSMFVEPPDREVNCQASAWSIDGEDDVRIRMCIKVNEESFRTIHHELGHSYYHLAYAGQSLLYRAGANDGFHEAVGDAIALSVTPGYLQKIGLREQPPQPDNDIAWLLQQALERVAFLPFAMVVEQWRWQIFAGQAQADDYNTLWWALREQYQGVMAPRERPRDAFDPGAKYHISANVPFSRYFIARILQFQMHRALCEASGFDGPLHQCSIYGSKLAGEKLQSMMAMGRSQPWQDTLEMLTGERELDPSALLEYFAPLQAWLEVQNVGRQCGW